MINSYRKRFILTNLLFVGLVLILAFSFLGSESYKRQYDELAAAMRMVSEPWDMGRLPDDLSVFDGSERDENAPKPPEEDGAPSDSRDKRPPQKDALHSFTFTLFDGENLSVITNNLDLEESEIIDIFSELKEVDDGFGRLSSRGVIFYKETDNLQVKTVLASAADFDRTLILRIVMYAAMLTVSLGLVFLISFFLSKTAVKPLEQAIDMERRFITDVSHDLKTPISVALANNNIIRSSPQSAVQEQLSWLDSTDDSLKNMLGMINDMLTLSSLESVRAETKKEPVNLSELAEKCVLQMEAIAYEKGVTMESEISPSITVKTDGGYVQRIFGGLIDNALKYEPTGGKIKATLAREKKNVAFSVTNFGTTIKEEDLPHVFERFYRSDKARTEKQGHGLGLAITKQLSEMIGAKVEVSSSEENGTTFTVIFQ